MFSAVFAAVPGYLATGSAAFGSTMALTAAGTSDGFKLTTFATGFPTQADEANGTAGPLGMAFVDGGVFVGDAPGNVRFFPTDTDGQTIAAAPSLNDFGFNNALGVAQVGANVYLAQQTSGKVVQINPTSGAVLSTLTSIGNATGITLDPSTQHLFVSTYQANNVYDVDPSNGTTTLFTNAFLDGLSTDGTTLYGADPGTGHVLGFNIATKAQVFDSGAIAGVPDGTALGAGKFAGDLFANTNGGTLVEINLATQAQTLIASGGSRGDFVQVDPSNDTLLLTQTDSILRLAPPSGAGFNGGGGNPTVPLPAAAWQTIGFFGIAAGLKSIKALRSAAHAR
jgi:hypothetical protein